MGFKVPRLQDVDRDSEPYALEVLAAVLDADESGRLTRNIVRGARVANQVGAGYDSISRGPTLFMLDGTPAEGRTTADVEQALRAEIAKIAKDGVAPEELERVKTQYVAGEIYKRDSRLYEQVREERGMAYSVYSYFTPKLQPGPFTIGLQTQKAQTDLALGVVRDTVRKFLAAGPSEQELRAAKANLIGGFALRIDSNAEIVENLALIGFYGLPLDYLNRWPDRIGAVTLTQVRDAFARELDMQRMATVVVGAGTPSK